MLLPGIDWPWVPVLPSGGLLVFVLKIWFPVVILEAGGTDGLEFDIYPVFLLWKLKLEAGGTDGLEFDVYPVFLLWKLKLEAGGTDGLEFDVYPVFLLWKVKFAGLVFVVFEAPVFPPSIGFVPPVVVFWLGVTFWLSVAFLLKKLGSWELLALVKRLFEGGFTGTLLKG